MFDDWGRPSKPPRSESVQTHQLFVAADSAKIAGEVHEPSEWMSKKKHNFGLGSFGAVDDEALWQRRSQ